MVMREVQVATVRAQVGLSLITDFENYSVFKPTPALDARVTQMLDQVVSWGTAPRTVRAVQKAACRQAPHKFVAGGMAPVLAL